MESPTQTLKRVDCLIICPTYATGTSPLGVMYIAGYVRAQGFSVEVMLGRVEEVQEQLRGFDLTRTMVGFSAATDVVDYAFEICRWIKTEISPDVFCVIGGIHATTLPDRTMQESRFDCLVFGEGEQTALELLRQHHQNAPRPWGLPGTWERLADGSLAENPAREFIKDLDILAFPAYDLVELWRWRGFIRTVDVHCRRVAYFISSRGCPFDCVFCDSRSMWNRRLRVHSTAWSVDLMEKLIADYQVDGFSFLDDEIVAFKKRILEMCEEMKKRGLHERIKWSAHATARLANEEIFTAMREAGCVLVRVGMESGSDRVLKQLKSKADSVEKNHRAIAIAKQAGLNIFGSFIIGSPDEDIDDIVRTIRFIIDSGLTDAALFVAVPYPGTALYDIANERGYIRPGVRWRDYCVEGGGSTAIVRNKHFTSEQLDAIKRFINIHVIEPLNARTPIKPLDYHREIEKIIAGDRRMTEYSFATKVNRQVRWMARRVLAKLSPT